MAQSYKICPICRTPNHPNAALCSTCGTTLVDVEIVRAPAASAHSTAQPTYDPMYGEADLLEDHLRGRGQGWFLGGFLLVGLLICGGLVFWLGSRFIDALPSLARSATPTRMVVSTLPRAEVAPFALATNTPRPTLDFDTVTPAPPTATPMPTQGPCMVQVQPGDDLITLAYRCGHRSLDILPLILEINNLEGPDNIQAGQTLEIPLPTPTTDPDIIPTEEVESGDDSAAFIVTRPGTLAPAEEALLESAVIATETLQPGVTWHRVQPDENAVLIASLYGADIEILSQLNPEITFSQCDFGSFSGGPSCIVPLFIGQLVRVPAPTPTPTIPPTPSGSETSTPSATPTFNAPNLSQPANRSLFRRNELITLRWVPTGTLADDEVYRVRVEDRTAGIVYTAETRDIFYIVPEAWQGSDSRRHEYTWSVSIVQAGEDELKFTTEALTFSWEGLAFGAATPTP